LNDIIISFDSPSNNNFSLQPYNINDDNIYFKIIPTSTPSLLAGERLRFAAIPKDTTLTSGDIFSYLSESKINDISSSGIFIYEYTSNDTSNLFPECLIKIYDNTFENTQYDLYWTSLYNGLESTYINNNSVYSNIRNIRSDDVIITSTINTDYIDYNIKYNEINNDDLDYGEYGPYVLKVTYHPYNITSPNISGYLDSSEFIFEKIEYYYDDIATVSGINIALPYYFDDSNIPAVYRFEMAYRSLNGNNSNIISSTMDHRIYDSIPSQQLSSIKNINTDYVIKSGDIKIPKEVNPYRKRLSIGIQDIAINKNIYNKTGTYISKQKILPYYMYTFSLEVNEYIPDYKDINKYDTVKYYISFNDNKWIRISPINRVNEYENEQLIPKLIVFDKEIDNNNKSVLYIPESINNSYIYKVVFDLSSMDDIFVPPEIREIKCNVSDRNIILNSGV